MIPFSLTVTFDEPKIEQNTPTKIEKSDDLFTPPQGLEVESGSDIVAKRKGKRSIPKPAGRASSKIFKVRELSGKKAVLKTGNKPKKANST